MADFLSLYRIDLVADAARSVKHGGGLGTGTFSTLVRGLHPKRSAWKEWMRARHRRPSEHGLAAEIARLRAAVRG